MVAADCAQALVHLVLFLHKIDGIVDKNLSMGNNASTGADLFLPFA